MIIGIYIFLYITILNCNWTVIYSNDIIITREIWIILQLNEIYPMLR